MHDRLECGLRPIVFRIPDLLVAEAGEFKFNSRSVLVRTKEMRDSTNAGSSRWANK